MTSDNIYDHVLDIVEVTVNTIEEEARKEGFKDLEEECEKFLTNDWKDKELQSEDWEGIRDFARRYEGNYSLIKNEAYKLKDFRPVMDLFRDLEEDMKYIGEEMQPQLYAIEKGDDYSRAVEKMYDALGKDNKSFLEHFGDLVYSAKFAESYDNALDREKRSVNLHEKIKNSVEKAENHMDDACAEIMKNRTRMADMIRKRKEEIHN